MSIVNAVENKFGGLAKLVGEAAPLVASALGSPLEGVAVSLLAGAFGVDVKDINGLQAAISADPEAAIKLKTIEYDHADTLARLASQDYSTEVDDRKDARQREIKLGDHVPTILALIFTLVYAGIQFCAIYAPHNVDDIISARVQDIMIIIVGYYFGSSNKKLSDKM